MGKFKPSTPDTSKQEAALEKQEAQAAKQEEKANRELSSSARFAKSRRTGRRLLLAPGRENEVAQLGGGGGGEGNF